MKKQEKRAKTLIENHSKVKVFLANSPD